jgi:hypothetical protein
MLTTFLTGRAAATRSSRARGSPRTLRAVMVAVAGLALVGSLFPAVTSAAPMTYSITGSVKNVSATAVPGIAVAACYSAFDVHTDPCSPAATTAADGTFTVGGLGPRAYVVMLIDPAKKYPAGWYAAGGFTVDHRAVTKVLLGTTPVTAGIDVVYPAIFTMSGRITGSDGSPMPGAIVAPMPADILGVSDNMRVATGGDGRFSAPVVGGPYWIYVSDESQTAPRFFSQPYRAGGATSGPATVVWVAAEVTGLDLRLQPASRISGHVGGTAKGVWISGCPTGPTGSCEGSGVAGIATSPYTVAVPRTKVVVRVTGAANSPTLPGYWTKAGLVPDRAHATVLDLTRADATGVDVTTVALRTGIHAGTATSGSFFTKLISVKKGTSVTMKTTLAKGFAGAKVQIQAAVFDAKGVPGLFRTVATKTVAANGTVFYTTKVSTMTGYRAKYVPPQELVNDGITPAYSVNLVVRVK